MWHVEHFAFPKKRVRPVSASPVIDRFGGEAARRCGLLEVAQVMHHGDDIGVADLGESEACPQARHRAQCERVPHQNGS